MFSFRVLATKGRARAGEFVTEHGVVKTPIYMPVGTRGTVKALSSEDVAQTQAQILLGNTYHLYLKPRLDVIREAGGLHEFMRWDRPILTDSGGFQVFSLGEQIVRKGGVRTTHISENGVEFTSIYDGSKHLFTPERAVEIQQVIGADIMMCFDQLSHDSASVEEVEEAVDRTTRWAERCVNTWENAQRKTAYGKYQSLFGIIQGGMVRALRERSAREISALPFDGIAVGGETVGYNMEGTVELMEWIESMLPKDKPRYAMGLGHDPQNIIDAVRAGFDMFDCVAPTRIARNGALYVGELVGDADPESWRFSSPYPNGRLQIGNATFTHDHAVIDQTCDCATCVAGYSRAYLRHLFYAKELAYYRLASIHNVRSMIRLCEQLRERMLRV
ncbi:MAG: Queuine tRNA-ribosyltransferase [Microgenomates group bacterium GW2011_GWF2_45_18]|nr:MAG: Queuine tRNA-ribosyltransferase [Microgenomates group bacterium GW2011_GWF1_44_10]KKU01791.1 MAG: Queuine tRNA-ribosyltransferase [Microgenomates group bacterium GW2011_GWF2_45_18]HAU98905.1 tRNA guanosine(34) transglycosylase Tgt [Candidatus Paceibacterota bacterium]HAX01138.1 tRNA guanosine(34) transglycosylase Tgt [Candidatus Paceibacterota bacterium]